MTPDIETIIIGGGVIGLAIAKSLAYAGQDIMVLERHRQIGSEVSARNSEVIHAGLYYPPNSLRAFFCVEGKKKLTRFCAENGVTTKQYGKLLLATHSSEIEQLQMIANNAQKCGVDDLVALSAHDVKALEPELTCHAAVLSPSTGIIDSHSYMQALAGHIESKQGQIILGCTVISISQTKAGLFSITTESDSEQSTLTCRYLINAGGLGASDIGNMLPQQKTYEVPHTTPAKGHYYQYNGKLPFKHLIYPMPSDAWLGIHLTIDTGHKAKFGPDLVWKNTVDYTFEDDHGTKQKQFENEIRRYWAGLPDHSITPDYVGIRPKIYRQSERAADFAIHSTKDHNIKHYIGLYGIESPGLTASLAIGEYVASLLTSTTQ